MRDKLRKRIALSAVTALTLFAAVPVYADTYDAVYDDAALLSDEEQQSLSEESPICRRPQAGRFLS